MLLLIYFINNFSRLGLAYLLTNTLASSYNLRKDFEVASYICCMKSLNICKKFCTRKHHPTCRIAFSYIATQSLC